MLVYNGKEVTVSMQGPPPDGVDPNKFAINTAFREMYPVVPLRLSVELMDHPLFDPEYRYDKDTNPSLLDESLDKRRFDVSVELVKRGISMLNVTSTNMQILQLHVVVSKDFEAMVQMLNKGVDFEPLFAFIIIAGDFQQVKYVVENCNYKLCFDEEDKEGFPAYCASNYAKLTKYLWRKTQAKVSFSCLTLIHQGILEQDVNDRKRLDQTEFVMDLERLTALMVSTLTKDCDLSRVTGTKELAAKVASFLMLS